MSNNNDTNNNPEEKKIKVSDKDSLAMMTKRLKSSKTIDPTQTIHLTFTKGKFPPHFDQHVDKFLVALASTKANITTVSFQPDFLKAFTFPATAIRFCQAIGKLSSLRNFQTVPGQRHIQTSTQHLALIPQHARQLESLTCHWTVFGGTTRDFRDLAASIHSHPTLQKVLFKNCVLVRRNRSVDCVGPVLEALRTVPQLEELTLSCWIPGASMEAGADLGTLNSFFADLCRHPNLKVLTLQDPVPLAGGAFEGIMTAIQNSSTLKSVTLDASCIECYHAGALLAGVIRANRATLEQLTLQVSTIGNINDQHLSHVLCALEANMTLKAFTIRSGPSRFTYVPSNPIQQQITSLLETKNLTLTQFNLTPPPQEVDGFLLQMNYYLTLNRAGRKFLLENPDVGPSRWMDALNKSKHDASALFYFLSRNPTLCKISRKRKEPSSSTTPDEKEEEEEEEVEQSTERPTKKRRVK